MELTASSHNRILGIPNRYLVLVLLIGWAVAFSYYPPVLVHIQLPAEELTHPVQLPVLGKFALTNTMLAMLLSNVILLVLAFSFSRAAKAALAAGGRAIGGVSGAVEALMEMLYNLTETNAGRWAREIFPWFATIVLVVLVNNWLELIPGVDSIGILHAVEHGYAVQATALGASVVGTATHEAAGGVFELVPFVRVNSTDLNFTVSLALIAVVMVQVFGIRALGAGYFKKFWNTSTLFTKPVFGVIDFGVGLLELVSEFSKVLSFSFRLFGNVFAGSVLLFVIGYLVPTFAQTIFLMLEFVVGLIQAVVFGMLTMVFMSQAVVSHHGDEHSEAEGAAAHD